MRLPRTLPSFRHSLKPSHTNPYRSRLNSTSTDSAKRHGNWYREFGRPVAKNFLIALATYQVLYWSWLKMESLEVKEAKGKEVERLEGKLKELVKKP